MSSNNWQIPPEGGLMESTEGIYMQNMNSKELEARLKENDLLIIPIGSTEAQPGDTHGGSRGQENRLHRLPTSLVWQPSLSPHRHARHCARG